jgi:hypothetical protein
MYRTGIIIGHTGVARKVLVCKIVVDPIHCGPPLPNYLGFGPQGSSQDRRIHKIAFNLSPDKKNVVTKKCAGKIAYSCLSLPQDSIFLADEPNQMR